MAKPFIFQDIAKRGRSQGYTPQASREAIRWFRQTAKSVRAVNVNRLLDGTPTRLQARVHGGDIGQMFSFFYDPKHKATLPYWDQHPLILPFHVDRDHMKAFNLHYLSPYRRARVLDALYSIAEHDEDGKVTNLPVSYGLLSGLARAGDLRPCVKMYLWNHVKSYFFWVRPEEWDMSIMLPTARFVGATHHKVHRDSARRI